MWTDVYEDLGDLTESQQLAFIKAMIQDLFPDDPDKITSLLKSIREARFASGLGSVHCGSGVHQSNVMANIAQENGTCLVTAENRLTI